ncbi:hypothetical protein PN36_18270 [Candidatus Thiomargarita nelsonii]|uniref:Cytoplasmic protein n=1 Tax=Candidatus Thiomargarita nelsonii TaxID=1003181 RepID=A0A0A6P5G0_9GAMM|nr:hypothetical protein PN36_18270 [Candidatus Thiomargarita nelsonii]
MKQHKALISQNLIFIDTSYAVTEFSNRQAYALQAHIMQLGYIFSEKDIHSISICENFNDFAQNLIKTLKDFTGADREWQPMYPGFPQQIVETSELELIINAIIHYWSGGQFIPPHKAYSRSEYFPTEFKTLKLINREELKSIIAAWIESGVSLSEQQKDAVLTYFDLVKDDKYQIQFKETLAFLAQKQPLFAIQQCNTVTDVLRVASAFSDGDYTLIENTKFKLSLNQKRNLCARLQSLAASNPVAFEEDMAANAKRWQKLLHHIMPHKNCPESCVDLLRFATKNYKLELRTFESKLEEAIALQDTDELSQLFTRKPGLLARRLNELLCKGCLDLSLFKNTINKISNRVLWQLYGYFMNRDIENDRIIRLKNGKLKVISPLQPISSETSIDSIISIIDIIKVELQKRYSEFKIGKVDDAMKKVPLPLNMRSASDGTQLPFGTRIPLGDVDYLRFGVHWFNEYEDSPTDIDLSGIFYNKDFSQSLEIGWYSNYIDENAISMFSGDLVNAPKPHGAAEFIDVKLNKACQSKWTYVAIFLNLYSGNSFETSHAVMNAQRIEGLCGQENMKDIAMNGKAFEPARLLFSTQIKKDSDIKQMLVCLIDTKYKEVIWIDMPKVKSLYSSSSTEVATTADVIKAFISRSQPSLFDLYSFFEYDPKLPDVSWANRSPYDLSGVMGFL